MFPSVETLISNYKTLIGEEATRGGSRFLAVPSKSQQNSTASSDDDRSSSSSRLSSGRERLGGEAEKSALEPTEIANLPCLCCDESEQLCSSRSNPEPNWKLDSVNEEIDPDSKVIIPRNVPRIYTFKF